MKSRLQEIFGGNAVSDEYHIGRHVANLFVTQTYEGQSDIHGTSSPSLHRPHDLDLPCISAVENCEDVADAVCCLRRSVDPRPSDHGPASILLMGEMGSRGSWM